MCMLLKRTQERRVIVFPVKMYVVFRWRVLNSCLLEMRISGFFIRCKEDECDVFLASFSRNLVPALLFVGTEYVRIVPIMM